MYFSQFCCISPAGILTPGSGIRLEDRVNIPHAVGIEPDYGAWIPPMQLRRMSRQLKMGLTAAKICLEGAGLPHSIHIGSAYGMLSDSEAFLAGLIERKEAALSPTAFIQSTHNTLGGQIALALQCHVHNMTFAHRGHSFESATLDAIIHLEEYTGGHALLGAAEETTATSLAILSRFPYYEGLSIGEGAAFFRVSSEREPGTLAYLRAFEMLRLKKQETAMAFKRFLTDHRLTIDPEDFCLLGRTGFKDGKLAYQPFQQIFRDIPLIDFKDYCGEYPTSSAFALGMGLSMLYKNTGKKLWIVNNYKDYWSFWCLQR